ncbi:MAG: glutamate--tRNA ligase family protein [Acidobacteria bacterium]|nr:glutamate--tRNA ligase family protein [Acidobacteriota bacterium]MDA1234214.1 glutamate--tRNA ligase family protein [Acidobacteriota bacterium]
MTPTRRTRYAPSPTGYLHLGHVAHMLYVWGAARAFGAEVIVRMEDHDRGRCRPEFEAAILEDMDWLGFVPANVLERRSPYRQSDCEDRYEAALERLKRQAHVYRCSCSRKQIAARVLPSADGELPYDGLCRNLESTKGGIRIELGGGAEFFLDGLLGEQSQDPSVQCGDLLLRDRSSQWTYQFAVTVDDLIQDVDLVVRGEDLLPSTGRQIRLGKLLGREQAALFVHHPLIRDDDGGKLSKKEASAPIRETRRKGVPPQQVLGSAAQRVGLTLGGAPQEREALLELTAKRLLETCTWSPDYSASNLTPSINKTPRTTKAT